MDVMDILQKRIIRIMVGSRERESHAENISGN
jgi:hypothetical protein